MKRTTTSNRRSREPDGREIAALMLRPHEEPPQDGTDRVPFDPHLPFYELRRRAIAAGERYGGAYERLLSLLEGVEPLARHEAEEHRGASYKRLCAAAHMAGLSLPERKNFYWICERVGLSDRFAGHIIARLRREGRADG